MMVGEHPVAEDPPDWPAPAGYGRRVLRQGEEVHLTPTEYDLLRFLAGKAGRVITHGHLLRSTLGEAYADANGTLRVHIASLRKKLELDPSSPRIILTEPGIGYRLRVD